MELRARTVGGFPAGDEVSEIGVVYDLMVRPWWHGDAACRKAPANVTWFPAAEGIAPMTRSICGGCPVSEPCLTWALGQGPTLAGIWGGTSSRQRKRMLRATRLGVAGETVP
jgi:WhiB family redox-sensing transcriptional regulator